ncbi:class I SAM-dependent methyltransferase [Lysinibacillus piscis]|uniref:SAM-dependent methyltransferase n=1 Tax=Lysinibacillus piscis TaxID=2518931 RepID=A0ABQ5NGK0_9BACI|nr:rRNA adenine N-6-methyltransferase family protein [Lysinibacillus sp. KH24]GLC87169.1 SAM-dependent methyltransferase [Lysinibacillus sp. KH24]
MQFITFIHEFLKNPKSIGAISPSSKKLTKKMLETISFEQAECIIELGPGTGSFTMELIKKKKPLTKLILIDNNAVFCEKLRRQLAYEPNVEVIHGSAENLCLYMDELHIKKIDYIVSGLPFTSLSPIVSASILQNIRTCMEDGEFITFQYSLVRKSLIQQFFDRISHTKVWMNIPPAYVLRCK